MLYHAVNITTIEAELFTIRYGSNQIVQIPNSSCIIVITDTLCVVQKNLISSSIPINSNWLLSQKISDCFSRNIHLIPLNFGIVLVMKNGLFMHLWIMIWKKFNLIPLFPCKTSWDFNKKEESDSIIRQWHMNFQASGLKGKQFLNLLNDDLTDIEPLYTKGGP